MNALLAESGAGLLGLFTLLLWPGLLIVRAPWPFVPFLSLSFWLVSWDWLAGAGPGRHRFLVASLAFFVLLSGLRLLKPIGARWPSWPTVVVVAAAAGRLAPFLWWPVAPGPDAAFSSSSALLLVWRDGLPASYLPLYRILGFGLGDSGLAAFAADISLLAGVAPHRSLLLATLASEGLFTLAVFALARRYWPGTLSALVAASGAAMALLLAAHSGEAGGAALASAFVIGGGALVLPARGRSPCVAAGALWAGAAAASALLAAAGGLATLLATGGGGVRRWGLAAAVALLLAGPMLWRTANAGGFPTPGLASLGIALFFLAAIPALAGRGSWPAPRTWLIAAGGTLALAATLAGWELQSARIDVSADELEAAAWLREHSRATDVVCADEEGARAWIPALAGRAARPERWPDSVRPSRFAPPLSACRFVWGTTAPGPRSAEFQAGRVRVTRSAPGVLEDP